MSALATGPPDPIADQDRTHGRIRELLGTVTATLLAEQPQLSSFADHRPERDRPSGTAWRGLETMCHVSALLASVRPPEDGSGPRLLGSAEIAAGRCGLSRHRSAEVPGVAGTDRAIWMNADGDRLDVMVGVRVTVRAISAPFLPGSLDPLPTTSPPSPISPPTPPPRPRR